MEPQINKVQSVIEPLKKVTPVSKYLAMALFVLLPFLGGWIGYTLAPEKIVEVEKIVEIKPADTDLTISQPISTTTIDMGEYRIRYDQDVVQLINDKSEVLQSIDVEFGMLDGFIDAESLLIINRDINYDHYLDIGILNNVGYGGVNRFYHFYTYDSVAKRLVLEESLGQNEGAISNPTFDIEKKYLYSNMKSGQDWIIKQFIFSNGKYIDEYTWGKMYGVQKDSE